MQPEASSLFQRDAIDNIVLMFGKGIIVCHVAFSKAYLVSVIIHGEESSHYRVEHHASGEIATPHMNIGIDAMGASYRGSVAARRAGVVVADVGFGQTFAIHTVRSSVREYLDNELSSGSNRTDGDLYPDGIAINNPHLFVS